MRLHRLIAVHIFGAVAGLFYMGAAWAAPIHDAIAAQDAARVKALLAQDPANANLADARGSRPLCLAAIAGNEAIADELIVAGADLNDGGTIPPLACAAYAGALDLMKKLLDKGVSATAMTAGKSTMMHFAAQGRVRTVTRLGDGKETYTYAPNMGAVALLLARGVPPGAADANGVTPLHFAAADGNPGIVTLLLAAKVPVDARSASGATPLHYASQRLERLVARDGDWRTFKMASNVESVRLLIAAGADVNAAMTDDLKMTPLMIAAAWGLGDVVRALLEAKADVSLKSADGKTALHFAAESVETLEIRQHGEGDQQQLQTVLPTDTIAALLKAGADPAARDNAGHTPADVVRNQEPEVVKLLKAGP